MEAEALPRAADFTPAKGLLDNTQVAVGYIAHVAVPCRDLEETARWYSEVLGAQPVRILHDRVTFSFGGVLQLVCHLERRAGVDNPRAYPRHHGLTFLRSPLGPLPVGEMLREAEAARARRARGRAA